MEQVTRIKMDYGIMEFKDIPNDPPEWFKIHMQSIKFIEDYIKDKIQTELPPEFMDAKEVQKYLGIGYKAVRKLMKADEIKSVWQGNKLVAIRKSVISYAHNMSIKPYSGSIDTMPVSYLNNIVKKAI